MDKYVIAIEEADSREFNVCASSPGEAIRSEIEKYKCGVFVLEPGCVTARRISANGAADEWYDF